MDPRGPTTFRQQSFANPTFPDLKIFIQEVILTPGYLVTKNQWTKIVV